MAEDQNVEELAEESAELPKVESREDLATLYRRLCLRHRML